VGSNGVGEVGEGTAESDKGILILSGTIFLMILQLLL